MVARAISTYPSLLTITWQCAFKSKSSYKLNIMSRLGMLEECIIYLKGGIQQISEEKFYKSKKISMRSRRVAQECKLKLQLCAILSQNQNHYEALENARRSVKLAH